MKKIVRNNYLFFAVLFCIVSLLFYKAFSMHYFADDYFFLQISHANNISQFLHFYSPIRDYSYKPLASETFYFILHLMNTNVFWGHVIMFVTYFVGLIFLYKVLFVLTKNELLSKLSTFIYAISFIHVFQLYWFGTYQEIALFTFLVMSFYYFVVKKYIWSVVFFILASFCKETAALYTPFLFLYVFFGEKAGWIIKRYYKLGIFVVLTIIFYSLYKTGLSHVTSLDNYKMEWNPRLLLNNTAWYSIWGLGFPMFMPDYFPKLFAQPLPAFWDIVKIPGINQYFYQLITYWVVFIFSFIVLIITKRKKRKNIFLLLITCIIGYLLFLGPILLFPHKWMIRLTVPLIFFSFFQAFIIVQLFKQRPVIIKLIAIVLLILYCSWNYYGISTHESSSLYDRENEIYNNANKYFTSHRTQIEAKHSIFFEDTAKNKTNIFNNSQKLKLSFHDQSFIDHFFPGYNLKAVYNFETSKIPPNAYIIDTNVFF